ncbi:hypothetical protein [Pseudonocardia xishanensis]|uniref:Uncharacterized protein n=1 Tax=Pseudonocardia xishanensis TaxID=630995 RepID=A0ABP8RBT9_9PSEU
MIVGASVGLALAPLVLVLATRSTRTLDPTPSILLPVVAGLIGLGAIAGASTRLSAALVLLTTLAVVGGAAMIVDVAEGRLPNRLIAIQSVAVALVLCVSACEPSWPVERLLI